MTEKIKEVKKGLPVEKVSEKEVPAREIKKKDVSTELQKQIVELQEKLTLAEQQNEKLKKKLSDLHVIKKNFPNYIAALKEYLLGRDRALKDDYGRKHLGRAIACLTGAEKEFGHYYDKIKE